MESLWEQTWEQPSFPALDGDRNTDVLIVGGGMAGILCAYQLHGAGVPYVLVEAETICNGITKNTTAKITSQHGLIYDKLVSKFGIQRAKQYLAANEAALETYRQLCRNMDCDFEEKAAYTYSLDDAGKVDRELNALDKLGFSAECTDQTPLPFHVAGAIRFPHQAQFHPLKFVSGITKNLHIYEHTRVQELIGTTAVTDHGRIRAKKIIVTTHFPFLNKHGSYFLKLYQHRSYVIALEGAPNVDGMYVDQAQTGMSFRNYKNLLLAGGGDHRTGKKGGGWRELRDFARRHYPQAKEVYHWATQDCMSLDGVPYIGPYSASTKDLYVATGFNKWGMTTSMVSAMILSDLVQGKKTPYEEVFSPSRSILHPQLAVNGFEAVTSLLTPTTKRCPHLGCALKWNPAEHTWDCPCHGSRFTQDGKLIDNPATDDLNN
ncbi:FAD-dependent oxidoreductase [Pseudoflavonifractor sp. An85]|uniref:FAD-dependent oxidoreductase n=1 Tax=Pseudoflavonifractor sp. An85 TaxID=1965661 RepID=UPI000B377415|nr:FAD-dependent oxidoreductase [Pseudoflavonifractor sp. An85]OUN21445.1 FAD-dependent oxidoreductase [Pseudoflavonifractor sp. An85]